MSAYLDLVDAVDLVRSLAQVTVDDNIIEMKLQASAGRAAAAFNIGTIAIPKDAIVFRCYYVAAKLIEQSVDDQRLKQAEGVTFTGLDRPITSLLMEQYATDQAYTLIIPTGFDAVSALQGVVGLTETLQLIGSQAVSGGLRDASPPVDDLIYRTDPDRGSNYYSSAGMNRW